MDSTGRIIEGAIKRFHFEWVGKEPREDRSAVWNRMREFVAAELTQKGTITLDEGGVVLIDAATEVAYHIFIHLWKGGPLEDEANWNLTTMYGCVWGVTQPMRRAEEQR